MSTIYERGDLLLKIPDRQREALLLLCRLLKEGGFDSYLVGGAVRDLVMDRMAGDLDIATNAPPDRVMRIFHKTIPTGIKHGTVTVLLGGEKFEVTTYRAESAYSDGRHPDSVSYSDSLEEDLKRRDFTINALAYDPVARRLIDLHEGVVDIEKKVVRTIGKPTDRFFEDGLRPVRACRFAATLNFDIESETYDALRSADVQKRVAMIAVERFSDELRKGFASERPSRMIDSLERSGLLYIFTGDTISHPSGPEALKMVDTLIHSPFSFKFASWLHSIGCGEEHAEPLSARLKLSNHECRDIRWGIRILNFVESSKCDLGGEGIIALRRFLSSVKEVYGDGSIQFLDSLRCHDRIPEIEGWIKILKKDPLTTKDLKIGGADMMQLGFQGREIGWMMKILLESVIEDPTRNNREFLLGLAQAKSRL